MDKYELLLDVIEHPEKYTAGQLNEIMIDAELRDMYNILCKTDSALESEKTLDVEKEWRHFADKHAMITRSRRLSFFGSRAASVALIIGSSLLAVGAGIAITLASGDDKSTTDSVTEAVVTESADNVSTAGGVIHRDTSVRVISAPVTFEDETLKTIIKTIEESYGVKAKFNNQEAADLHLYYKLDQSLPLDEVVSQLNTFEQINITLNGNTLTID